MPYLHVFTDQHCSNCGRTVDLQLLHAQSLAVEDGHGEHRRWREHPTDFRGLFSCSHCRAPVTVDFRLRPLTPIQQQEMKMSQIPRGNADLFLNRLHPELIHRPGSTAQYSTSMTIKTGEWGTKLNTFFTIIDRHPDSAIRPPSGLPKELEREFAELPNVAGSARYTVVACRRILDQACKAALGDAAPEREALAKLIDVALNRPETVSAITDWAHAIRVLGNEAVHDDSDNPTTEEAKEAVEFTSLLVELLFGYPSRIASVRGSKQ